MPTAAELRAMNQEERMAAIVRMSEKDLRAAQSSGMDAGSLRAVQVELQGRQAGRQTKWATVIAVVALVVAILAWLRPI